MLFCVKKKHLFIVFDRSSLPVPCEADVLEVNAVLFAVAFSD